MDILPEMDTKSYYNIALPVNLAQHFTYSSLEKLERGCRVLVSLRNNIYTGVVWEKCDEKDLKPGIKYLAVQQIVDRKPIVPESLMWLAEWISRYYKTPLGISFFSMLPTGLNVRLVQKAIRKSGADTRNLDEETLRLLSAIPADSEIDIRELPQVSGLHSMLERLEDDGCIEIRRSVDKEVKQKTVNYVITEANCREKIETTDLGPKQREAIEFILDQGEEFPLARIAEQFSYSIVKALRVKGLLRLEPRKVRDEYAYEKPEGKRQIFDLTAEQDQVLREVSEALEQQSFGSFLLYGITGSGKTEVYIRLIEKVIAKGQSALMLVPEISLTPQMVHRFYLAFGEDIAVLHSHLNVREKLSEWRKIRSGKVRIVIGARSAIFAPLESLGIIIVDEEHETSYKQESAPRYHARDIAVVRARHESAVVLMGSATPSLESWQNAQTGNYGLLKMTGRPAGSELPNVKIVDMRKQPPEEILSHYLRTMIEDRLRKREQVILFLNRRGHASFLQCTSCGKLFKCKNCDISLNYHSRQKELMCHYCGYRTEMPRKCPECGSYLFSYGAPGTQQAEEQIRTIFSQASILRMDADTTRAKDSYQSMFDRMRSGQVDILLGTQMISKGLDFPNITLVGVLSAEVTLNVPDFRSAERTFQLLTQVAGRAGRSEKRGEVVIQTYNPEHYSILLASRQDFLAFSGQELGYRESFQYPPFTRIARILFRHKDQKTLHAKMNRLKSILQKESKRFAELDVNVFGPVPAPITRLDDSYRYHVVLKSSSVQSLQRSVQFLMQQIPSLGSMKVTLDIDPGSLM